MKSQRLKNKQFKRVANKFGMDFFSYCKFWRDFRCDEHQYLRPEKKLFLVVYDCVIHESRFFIFILGNAGHTPRNRLCDLDRVRSSWCCFYRNCIFQRIRGLETAVIFIMYYRGSRWIKIIRIENIQKVLRSSIEHRTF